MTVSRRHFVGGIATAFGYVGLGPDVALWAQGATGTQGARPPRASVGEFDAFAKLSSNENPYGPPDSVILIDEAYHHFVDDPNYATSVPYVIDGRPVIVARTFSKIAALNDTASQAQVKRVTIEVREKTIAELESLGHQVIPSQANFFMVNLNREVQPVIDEFRKRGVLVGRPFPPMTQHLRVSVGTSDEMSRFLVAFKEILPPGKSATPDTHVH